MSGYQATLPLAGAFTDFKKYGQCGTEYSDLMSHTGEVADDLCVIRTMHTEAINHDPAITFMQTGSQIPGRPSMGAWLSYGLGSENSNLPGFVVLITKDKGGQPLGAHLWGTGFLPAEYQGLQFRPAKDPVLYLNNPSGISSDSRRMMLERHARYLPVLSNRQLMGVVSFYDVAKAVVDSQNFENQMLKAYIRDWPQEQGSKPN
jgi:hypothetical protein